MGCVWGMVEEKARARGFTPWRTQRTMTNTDLQDLPSNVRDDLAVTLCERIDDALAVGECMWGWRGLGSGRGLVMWLVAAGLVWCRNRFVRRCCRCGFGRDSTGLSPLADRVSPTTNKTKTLTAFEPLSPFDAAAPAAMDDGGGLRGGGNTSSSSSGGGNGAGGGNGGNIRVPPAPPMAAAAAQQQQQQRRLQTELEEEQDDANVSPYHPFFSRMPGDYRAAPPENKGGGGGGGVDLCGPVSRSML